MANWGKPLWETGPSSCSSRYSWFTNGALAACLDRSQHCNAEEFLISTNRCPSSSLCPTADVGWLSIPSGCTRAAGSRWGWGWGRAGAGETGQGREKTVSHRDKSEHPGHYITSPLRGEGCMLMTLWWMTDSVSISDGSQLDGTRSVWPN